MGLFPVGGRGSEDHPGTMVSSALNLSLCPSEGMSLELGAGEGQVNFLGSACPGSECLLKMCALSTWLASFLSWPRFAFNRKPALIPLAPHSESLDSRDLRGVSRVEEILSKSALCPQEPPLSEGSHRVQPGPALPIEI